MVSQIKVFSRILRIFAILIAVVLAGAAGFYVYLANLEGKRAEQLRLFNTELNRPIFFAHRGGAREAPENTIPAFQSAIANGVDVLELDVRATRDGELVVFHDSTLERTTNGSGPLNEKSLAELRNIDAGYSFSNDGGKAFPFRGAGVTIPTLREVFEKFPESGVNIELKDRDPAPAKSVCSLINEFKRKGSVIVASVDSAVLTHFRANCKGVATSASFRESLWFLFLYKIGLSENFNAEMQALQIPENLFGTNVVTDDFIRAAHERGLKIHIWTANKRSDIKRLVAAGVDGVMTDYPGRVRETFE